MKPPGGLFGRQTCLPCPPHSCDARVFMSITRTFSSPKATVVSIHRPLKGLGKIGAKNSTLPCLLTAHRATNSLSRVRRRLCYPMRSLNGGTHLSANLLALLLLPPKI